MANMREAHELLLIEEADAWFEYLEATRGQSALRYAEQLNKIAPGDPNSTGEASAGCGLTRASK